MDKDGKNINKKFLRQDLLKINEDELIKKLPEGEFVVDKVLARRVRNGKVQYKIKWLNSDGDSWENYNTSYKDAIKIWRDNQ